MAFDPADTGGVGWKPLPQGGQGGCGCSGALGSRGEPLLSRFILASSCVVHGCCGATHGEIQEVCFVLVGRPHDVSHVRVHGRVDHSRSSESRFSNILFLMRTERVPVLAL